VYSVFPTYYPLTLSDVDTLGRCYHARGSEDQNRMVHVEQWFRRREQQSIQEVEIALNYMQLDMGELVRHLHRRQWSLSPSYFPCKRYPRNIVWRNLNGWWERVIFTIQVATFSTTKN